MINLLTIYFFISLKTSVEFVVLPKSKVFIYMAPIGLIFYLINYFALYKNRESLDSKYKNQIKRQRITGWVLLGIYFFGSFILAYYIGAKHSNSIVN